MNVQACISEVLGGIIIDNYVTLLLFNQYVFPGRSQLVIYLMVKVLNIILSSFRNRVEDHHNASS